MIKDENKRKEYYRQYRKNTDFRVNLAFRIGRDADIIEYLKTVPNKTDLICTLLRQHMQQEKGSEAK